MAGCDLDRRRLSFFAVFKRIGNKILEDLCELSLVSAHRGKEIRGDYGILMTMGPGSTIETALIRW